MIAGPVPVSHVGTAAASPLRGGVVRAMPRALAKARPSVNRADVERV